MSNLKLYIKEVSEILEIVSPKIVYNDENFVTKTQLAVVTVDKGILYLPPNVVINADTLFAIAHELRRIWQYNNEYWKQFIISHIDNLTLSVEDYNSQPEEIDANAFGWVIMECMFNLTPSFTRFNPKLIEKIRKRAEELVDELDFIN